MSEYFYSLDTILRHGCFKAVRELGTCEKSIALSTAVFKLQTEENQ